MARDLQLRISKEINTREALLTAGQTECQGRTKQLLELQQVLCVFGWCGVGSHAGMPQALEHEQDATKQATKALIEEKARLEKQVQAAAAQLDHLRTDRPILVRQLEEQVVRCYVLRSVLSHVAHHRRCLSSVTSCGR